MTAIVDYSSPGARRRNARGERPGGQTVLRGREAEQKIIDDLLRCAQRGIGAVVLVDGEPGTGKSVLLRYAADEAGRQGFALATAAADQFGQAIPFSELRAALRKQFAGPDGEDPGREVADATAWWIDQVRARLERLAVPAPVLVCLDDLHWASPATLAALRALPRELRRQPVAWLLARSSTCQRRGHYLFSLLEKDGATRVTLGQLDENAVTAMLTDAFGVPPAQCLADLARAAVGSPWHVAELIAGLQDDHAVQVVGGCAVLASERLPRRIYLLAERWLAGLSEQTRLLVVTAAALGPRFRVEDAAEMLGKPPATLLPAVDEALNAAIMTAAEDAFAFRHPLLCRAVAEMTPPPKRRR